MDRTPLDTGDAPPEAQGALRRHGGNFDDARMEAVMGRLLQMGVLLAASVILIGGVMYVWTHGGTRISYRTFVPKPVAVRHPAPLLRGIAHGDASAIIDLGILLLVATPISRVLSGVVAFSLERDRLYVAVSAIVLAVLLFGLLHGG